jgi:hypothetical protein
MRQRGRETIETLAALATESEPTSRLDPPDCLGAREVVEWRAIVARFGVSAFPRETHALLASICGAIVNLNDINLELSTFPPGIPSDLSGWNKFRDLIRLRGQLASQVAMIGTKLRVLPQSRDVRRLRTTDYERRLEEDGVKPWNDVN